VHLAGHSLGGRLALRLAALLGDRVASLTLIAPAGWGEANRDFVDGFVAADRRRPMKAALRDLIADPDLVTSEMIELTLAYKRLDGVTQALRALADDALAHAGAAVEDDLAAVTAPILAIWGRDDRILPASGADALRARGEVLLLDGVGHIPQMEAAEAVADALRAHWEGAK
jgi:pyruvate dehydrogenase E2 component (dihydrolipoamide acetyltransferase)